jgi:thioredoxin reductase (NADPH)
VAPLETSIPGVYAVGDVRSGSVKRVGGAIGEGAQVVASLHRYLGDAARPTL